MKNLIIILLLTTFTLTAKHMHKESEYQKAFAKHIQGDMEIVLDDKSRVDVLTDEYAIEVEFAYKIYEAAGQALFYSIKTGRNPGILLIVENPKGEQKYISRLLIILKDLKNKGYNIGLWIIDSEFKINRVIK